MRVATLVTLDIAIEGPVMTTLKTNEARSARKSPMATRVLFIGSGLAAVALLGLLAYFA